MARNHLIPMFIAPQLGLFGSMGPNMMYDLYLDHLEDLKIRHAFVDGLSKDSYLKLITNIRQMYDSDTPSEGVVNVTKMVTRSITKARINNERTIVLTALKTASERKRDIIIATLKAYIEYSERSSVETVLNTEEFSKLEESNRWKLLEMDEQIELLRNDSLNL